MTCQTQTGQDGTMSTDSDLIKLYSQRILALAARFPIAAGWRRRRPACASARRSAAPPCSVDLDVSDGRISRFART
jgi:hypothetical protein